MNGNSKIFFSKTYKNINYFNWGVVTLSSSDFQQFPLSMQFEGTSYSLLSGQSKKVSDFFLQIENLFFD